MTSEYTSPCPELIRLIAPVDWQTFLDAWGQRPLLIQRQAPHYFDDLISLRLVEDLLGRPSVFFPRVKLYNGSDACACEPADICFAPQESFDGTPTVIKGALLLDELTHGATLHFQTLMLLSPVLMEFCDALERYWGCDVHTNAFLTPPHSGKVPTHFDNDDNFIVQVSGRKRWKVWVSPDMPTVFAQEYDPDRLAEIVATREPCVDTVLEAGDTLYIPRGAPHVAFTEDSHSLHVGIGAFTTSWRDFIKAAIVDIEHELRDAGSTQRVPLVPAARLPAELERRHAALLQAFGERMTLQRAQRAMGKQVATFGHSYRPGFFRALEKLSTLTSSDWIELRPGTFVAEAESDGELELSFRRKTLRLAAHRRVPLRPLLAGERVRIGDLPGFGSDAERLEFAAQLVRAGLVVLCEGVRAKADRFTAEPVSQGSP